MVSVLILTKNEARDLPACIASVSWSDDIHVLDSGSTDDTCEIARNCGAVVTIKAYPNSQESFGGDEAAHRNWSLQNIPFKHEWVFLLDADERVTTDLAASIRSSVAAPADRVAFRVRRRDFFMKSWLKRTQLSPFYMRLFKPDKIRFERLINPVSVALGPVGSVSGYLDHYPFNKGLRHWLDRHNTYSTLEARQIVDARASRQPVSLLKALTDPDFHQRRFHQKQIFYRMPLRPMVKFAFLYVYKKGFLDGRAGFTYAVLQAIYDYMIVLKVRESDLLARSA